MNEAVLSAIAVCLFAGRNFMAFKLVIADILLMALVLVIYKEHLYYGKE